MADNETITDIIREIRAEANFIEESARGSLKAGEDYDGIAFTESVLESALDFAETKRNEADRLEAAHKRECGDCAKLREAVELILKERGILDFCHNNIGSKTWKDWDVVYMTLRKWVDKAMTALAAPARNCDVGTAKEQAERLYAYCKAHRNNDAECLYCPLFGQTGGYCELVWAQMPYEAGGAK